MNRLLAGGTFLAVLGLLCADPQCRSGEPASAKEALQALNEYIGGWKGNGTSEKNRSEIWKEEADWSWRFKGKDAWLTLTLKDGKHFKKGEMRYLPDREHYQLTLFDKADKPVVFEGKFKGKRLTLTHNEKGGRTEQLQMYLAGGGLRFIYEYAVKPPNRTLFTKEFQVAMTRAGESFGLVAKKVECIVTGGQGTMAVTYKGQTYYVCCSGCRDAFNEDPERYIKEYRAKRKKK
jgi:YHS domain-containing protein